MQDLESRTDRQRRIKGWIPTALEKAKTTLIGSGPLCHYVATALTGLEVGAFSIVDNNRFITRTKNEFLYLDNDFEPTQEKVYSLETVLSRMNRGIIIKGVHSPFVEQLAIDSDVIVDLTNDPRSKYRSAKYATKSKIPYISASTSRVKGSVISYESISKLGETLGIKRPINIEDFLLMEYNDKPQGVIPSGVIGGLVVDEIRKAIFKLHKDEIMLNRKITYNMLSKKRFDVNIDYTPLGTFDYKDKKVAVIGAGALGNFVAINLALLGIGKVTFIDYDIVQSSNLNRQPLFTFYDSVGKRKVDVITYVLRKINPKATFEGLYGKILNSQKEMSKEEKRMGVRYVDLDYLSNFDLIICCGDNPDVRIILNRYVSETYKKKGKVIPLIDGGTDPEGGNVAVYIPGKNACVNCQIGYSNFPRRPREETSCIADTHDPSVVYTNLVTASLLCGELPFLLEPKKSNLAINNTMYYYSSPSIEFNLRTSKLPGCSLCK